MKRLIIATVVVAAAVLGLSAPYARADGALTVTAPVSTALGSGAPGTTISAAIGPVTVTDDRALLSANWTVTAAETDFTAGAQVISATDATYAPGTVVTTGTITVTTVNQTLENSAQDVVTGTAGVGDNTASWDPTVEVSVPASAVAGIYTGTLTQSVSGTTPETASTTVTFTVTSGALSLGVPASANLGSGAPGTTISAAIGPVILTDDRALASASWSVTAAETDFTNGGQTIPASDASYEVGSVTTTGTITVTATNATLENPAQDVVTGTAGVGNNTATWDPVVAVNVPAGAAAGVYTGTLSHSGDPSTTITFTVVPRPTPSITTSQQPASATVGFSIADRATVTGGANPSGTVTFRLYNNPNGTGTPLFTDTEALSGGAAASAGYSATAAGIDYWVATYNGDSNNNSVTSGSAAEPVSVGYGFGGFSAPLPKSTLVKSGSTIPVKFVLTDSSGHPIAASTAAALASAGKVEAVLAGPAISPITVLCTWSSANLAFQCNIKTPRGLKTGTSNPYTITAAENIGGGFITAPPVGTAVNPETVYFK